jgi:hypothetical protein
VRQGTAFHLEATRLKSTLSPVVAAAAALAPVPDRQTIARIVEQVFTARGIPRRGSSTAASLDIRQDTSQAASKSGNPSDAGAFAGAPSFAPSAKGGDFDSDVRQGTAVAVPKSDSEKGGSAPEVRPPAPAHPLPRPDDVRMALTRDRKLYIGPKTILTPSARDLGNEHEIFIMTDVVPATKKRRSES